MAEYTQNTKYNNSQTNIRPSLVSVLFGYFCLCLPKFVSICPYLYTFHLLTVRHILLKKATNTNNLYLVTFVQKTHLYFYRTETVKLAQVHFLQMFDLYEFFEGKKARPNYLCVCVCV